MKEKAQVPRNKLFNGEERKEGFPMRQVWKSSRVKDSRKNTKKVKCMGYQVHLKIRGLDW